MIYVKQLELIQVARLARYPLFYLKANVFHSNYFIALFALLLLN